MVARRRRSQPESAKPGARTATLAYAVPETGRVRLRVYDLSGRLMATLVDGMVESGNHSRDSSRLSARERRCSCTGFEWKGSASGGAVHTAALSRTSVSGCFARENRFAVRWQSAARHTQGSQATL